MSCKWNEGLVISFLKAYRQHPCLWNPYHKDYYNCYEKNEALQKIIDNLGTPGFTVTDYLHQIKTIREKYKQEQTRTIKSLQTQKQYKSPVPWYNIVADMLTKVIDDEERSKQQNSYSVLRSLSSDNVKNQRKEKTGTGAKSSKIRPCNNAICDQRSRRSKSVEKAARLNGKPSAMDKPTQKDKTDKKVRYALLPQYKAGECRSKDREEDTSLSCKPTRDTEFDINVVCPTSDLSTSMNARCKGPCSLARKNSEAYETSFLKCPLCGWEGETDNKAKKIRESNIISYCGWCRKHVNGMMYTSCTGSDNVTRDDLPYRSEYSKENINNSGDFEFLQDLLKPSDIVSGKSKIESQEATKKYTDAAVQYGEVSQEISKNSDIGLTLQAEVIQDDPPIVNKLKCGTIEAFTQLKIILSTLNKNSGTNKVVMDNVSKDAQSVQCTKAECSEKGTHFSLTDIFPKSNKINIGVNTVTGVEKGVQNVIEIPDTTKRSVSIQTLNQIKQKDIKEDKCPGRCLTKSKEVAVNMVDQVSKGIQSKICISRGSLCCSISLRKVVEVGTAMSTHQIHSVGCVTTENVKELKSKYIQCTADDKFLPFNREKHCRSIKCNVRDSDFGQSSETEVQEFDDPCTTDTCSLNILNVIKENPTLAAILQQLLQSVLLKSDRSTQNTRSNAQTDHEYELKGNCLIDTTKLVNAVKEYMSRTLELNVSDNDNVKEFREKFIDKPFSRKVEEKQNVTNANITTTDNKLTISEDNIFQPLFGCPVIKGDKRQGIVEDAAPPREHNFKVSTFSNKEIGTCSRYRDFGSNGSLTQFHIRDVEIQSCAQLMKDSVCLAKHEQKKPERVNVGTQKRDPILVRVIKCTESQGIVRSDKETLTVGSAVDREKKCTDQRVETCIRETCTPPATSRKLKEVNLDKALRKECEYKAANNYCRRSVTFQDNICDKNCTGNLPYDWTDVTNSNVLSNLANSKIPLCVRSWKYASGKNK